MIIDGKAIANERAELLKLKVQSLKVKPKLAIILIGEDPASKLYVSMKIKKAHEVGIETEVVDDISKVSADATGIIVQLPCLNSKEMIGKIPTEKDVDGLRKDSRFLPATVKGILEMLKQGSPDSIGVQHDTCGTCVIVGRSEIVGKPLAMEMINRGATVTVCNSKTKNLRKFTKTADILVSATGVAGLITANMVKPGAIVIDVGSPKGDVDFEKVKDVVGAITPVPGGVGPMIIVSLLENVVDAAEQ